MVHPVEGETRVNELWLNELGTLAGHVLHDLRNSMQAVAVNLEVVRGRTSGAAANGEIRWSPGDLARFANNASSEFDAVAKRVEALAYLCRVSSGDAEVGTELDAIATLVAAAKNAHVKVESGHGSSRAGVSQAAARFVLTRLLLSTLREGGNVDCVLSNQVPVSLILTAESAAPMEVDSDVLSVTRDLHIQVDRSDNGLILTFPTTVRSDTVLV